MLMTRHRAVICGALFVAAWAVCPARAQQWRPAKVEVAFRERCETVVLRTVRRARREIRVAAFSFTRRQIAAALAERARAGVRVEVKADAHQSEFEFCKPALKILDDAGIEVTLIKMKPYRHMHNKFMVIDGRYVLTGSYNFTTAATEDNWENLVLLESTDAARKYREEWERIRSIPRAK